MPEGRPGPEDLLRPSDEASVKLITLGLAMALAGCASGPAAPPPPPAMAPPPPDLRGTWTGTWGGAPLTLVVSEQAELGAYSGLYFGPVQVLGQRVPGLAGVMTSTIGGNPVSASVKGWLGSSGTAVTLLLQARTPHGHQQLTLTRVQPERLVGRGDSDFPWGPRGDVELIRRPAT